MKQGVAGFKIDRSEERVTNQRDVKAYDGRTLRELRNVYPVLYQQAAFEAGQEVYGADFALLPRAAFTGSSKYGV